MYTRDNTRDTIAAISTAPGRAGIGVVRVSGHVLAPLCRAITGRELSPRRATHCAFLDADGASIDEGIALFFPAPHSYTGQDVVELQGHGGPVVLTMLLQRCIELGARIAEPGEFTERAFLNSKLDLAQAEGVIDLIDASTMQAARSAMRSLRGEFSAQIHEVSAAVVELRALVEATLDFPEEEIDFLQQARAGDRLEGVNRQLHAVIAQARQGTLLREGIHVALAGEPNVGKSSLLNRLAGEELAIVTDVPGTTRDAIRQGIVIGGVPVHVIDTAGLRHTADAVERLGVERAWKEIADADVVILVSDVTEPERVSPEILARLPPHVPHIYAVNKIDLINMPPTAEDINGETIISLSAKTGEGIDLLREAVLNRVGWQGQSEGLFLARERHLTALQRAQEHVTCAAQQGAQLELVAEDLRLAHAALSSIVGEYTTEDLLGQIFSRFCIGK